MEKRRFMKQLVFVTIASAIVGIGIVTFSFPVSVVYSMGMLVGLLAAMVGD